MKLLSPRIHAFVDYALVALFALAPTLFGFSGTPAVLCYALAAVHVTLTLFSDFPGGVVKLVPFTVHGALEAGIAPLLVAMPWLARFNGADTPRLFFIVTGVAVGITYLVTDYRSAVPHRGLEYGLRPSRHSYV